MLEAVEVMLYMVEAMDDVLCMLGVRRAYLFVLDVSEVVVPYISPR